MKTTLYKRNQAGQVSVWICEVDYLHVTSFWGTMKKTTKGYEVPNNLQSIMITKGEPEEAIKEAQSLISKKVNREGYTTHIPKTIVQLPMLAKKWHERTKEFESFALQPKLDGYRCFATNIEMRSRLNTIIRSVPHIEQALSVLPDGVKLDGELYIHGMDLQTISEYVKRKTPHHFHHLVEYHVYDMVLIDVPFIERVKQAYKAAVAVIANWDLNGIYSAIKRECPVKIVPTHCFNQSTEADTTPAILTDFHAKFTHEGFEGMMVRDQEGMYEFDKYSHGLLKYKARMDEEFQIVNVEEGHDRTAIFVCKVGNQTFNCSPRFTKDRKQQVFTNKERYIGKWLNVEFQKYTSGGIPFQPVGVMVLDKPSDKHG